MKIRQGDIGVIGLTKEQCWTVTLCPCLHRTPTFGDFVLPELDLFVDPG